MDVNALLKSNKSETKMTASVLKQEPNSQTAKSNANFIWQCKTLFGIVNFKLAFFLTVHMFAAFLITCFVQN